MRAERFTEEYDFRSYANSKLASNNGAENELTNGSQLFTIQFPALSGESTDSYNYPVYAIEDLDDFSFSRFARNSTGVRLRRGANNSSVSVGLQNKDNAKRSLSILNLKVGDIVTVYCSKEAVTFVSNNVKVVGGSENVAVGSYLAQNVTDDNTSYNENPTRYEVTSAGHLDLRMAQWSYVWKVTIETDVYLRDVRAELTGFAETTGYYYPVYTLSGKYGNDVVSPTATYDETDYSVSGSTFTYKNRTAGATVIKVSYSGSETEISIPAGVKYKQNHIDFSTKTTFPGYSWANKTGSISGFSDTHTAGNLDRYAVSTAKSSKAYDFFTLGTTQYAWTVVEGYCLYFSDDKGASTISVNDPSEGTIAILSSKVGTNDKTYTWAGASTISEIKEVENNAISFNVYDKDGKHLSNTYYAYTALDIYTPVSTAVSATYKFSDSEFEKADNGYYYRAYVISAIADDTEVGSPTITGDNDKVAIEGSVVKLKVAESVTITVSDGSTNCDLVLPAPTTPYLRTKYLDLSTSEAYSGVTLTVKNTKNTSNPESVTTIGGFTVDPAITRYNVGSANSEVTFNDITLSKSYYGWILCPGYGVNFSSGSSTSTHTATLTALNLLNDQIVVLAYKVGKSNNEGVWNETPTQYLTSTASSNSTSFSVYDKDSYYYMYQNISVYTPVSIATQNVNVNSAVGGMGTLVASYPMDFSGDDLKAYTAEIEGSTVTFTRIKKVPAYTPVLVKYKDEETAEPSINFCNAEDAETVSTNALKAGAGAAVATYPDETHTNFVLTTGNSGASHGFYFANGRTVAANRAYLQADTKIAAARLNVLFSDDEATGISLVKDSRFMVNGHYNLQGQRVEKPGKGLYIVNGKKVVIK